MRLESRSEVAAREVAEVLEGSEGVARIGSDDVI